MQIAPQIATMDRGMGLGKPEPTLELNLARNVKGNEKAFCKGISSKRKIREKVGLLLMGQGTW
ncbi:hypothetical protein QYF61_018783 [Mycteria americana]|uniref:Uncharacterized protein n=1 Tax=Mycteria americana TaxID=33587 RepID=A0AAN7PKI3_MYCAM|nr:hypothetical protein QYF61_018783 [Mycteria americana]